MKRPLERPTFRGRIQLNCTLENYGVRMCTGFNWLRTWSNGGCL